MPTDKILITNDAGEQVEATAPVIISASRSTDIPAFYAKWFFNRLAKGYCAWYNPFNQQKMYISFKNCKVIVFWTKNPKTNNGKNKSIFNTWCCSNYRCTYRRVKIDTHL